MTNVTTYEYSKRANEKYAYNRTKEGANNLLLYGIISRWKWKRLTKKKERKYGYDK